jgi:hypothetical protein
VSLEKKRQIGQVYMGKGEEGLAIKKQLLALEGIFSLGIKNHLLNLKKGRKP